MKYVFIDRRHIHYLDRVAIRFHQPVKDRGPVIAPDHPWEGDRLHVWSPPAWCPERNRWRLWYIGGEEMLPLYAESADGRHWEKPTLDRVPWQGSKKNNIVNLGFEVRSAKERRLVLLRDSRDPDPARRYKALTRVAGRLVGLVSADGLDWQPLPGPAVPSNDEYRLGWDALGRRFVATAKGAPLAELGRAVSLSLSEDFVHWTDNEPVFHADETDQALGVSRIAAAFTGDDRRRPLINDPDLYFTDIYNMPVFSGEGFHLALPVIFNQSGLYWYPHPDDSPPALRSNQDGILYPALAVSDDLHRWSQPDPAREPFIPLSPLSDAENYDYGAIHACAPVSSGDELWFYYYGARFTHLKKSVVEEAGLRRSPAEPMGAIFRARLRADGFASLRAGDEPGLVISRPVRVDGTKLKVNLAAPGGELRAELREAETGRALPGYSLGDRFGDRWLYSPDGRSKRVRFGTGARLADEPSGDTTSPVRGDHPAATVGWKNGEDLGPLHGRLVRVAFYLRNADLYSFWFEK